MCGITKCILPSNQLYQILKHTRYNVHFEGNIRVFVRVRPLLRSEISGTPTLAAGSNDCQAAAPCAPEAAMEYPDASLQQRCLNLQAPVEIVAHKWGFLIHMPRKIS